MASSEWLGGVGSTPVEYSGVLSAALGVELYFKRDDFLPGPGGGNKVRIVREILRRALKGAQEYDAVVSTGGVRSNLARIVAAAAGSLGWQCGLVLHGVEGGGDPHLRLVRILGAEVEVVRPELVECRIEAMIGRMEARGRRVLFIKGGGSSVVGACAYVDAAEELLRQEATLGIRFDTIVMPSGTGGTQAGLVCGFAARNRKIRVIGISVARSNPRGQRAVEELVRAVGAEIGLSRMPEVEFLDQWTCGGYEIADRRVWEAIELCGQAGVPLDPTYTGKAFLGMMDLVRTGRIAQGERVLFWHTGGLLNLFAAMGKNA